MTLNFKRVGPLYGKIGLGTSGETIAKRIVAAEGAGDQFKELDDPSLCALARSALLLPVKQDEISWFVEIFRSNDPTFAPSSDDRETSLLAGATLWSLMEDDSANSVVAALALSTGAFGQLRRAEAGPELLALAHERLRVAQRHQTQAVADATYRKKPDLEKSFSQLQQLAGANNFQSAWPPLKEALTNVNDGSEHGQRHIVKQLNELIVHLRQLEEEMRLHWWVVGGWSNDVSKPFASLDIGEAAIIAGKELADLTRSTAGPYSAAALLDILLKKGRRKVRGGISLAEAVVQTPREWRGSWASTLAGNNSASLCPLSLAASIAAESGDAADWRPRFQRETGIPDDVEVPPLDLGVQMLKERLLSRVLVDAK